MEKRFAYDISDDNRCVISNKKIIDCNNDDRNCIGVESFYVFQ